VSVLELELREDAPSQGTLQLVKHFGQILVRSENEVNRVARIEIKSRRESILGVSAENFRCGRNRVRPAVIRQVGDQPIEVLFFQGLSVNVDHVHGLPRAWAMYSSAQVGGES
jgi:hypothetical protein